MRTNQCFYCDAESVNDEKTLGHDFGIRYCESHQWDAKRDSNAYLHVANQVRTQDALKHPILGPWLSLLIDPTHVRRSSNMIENGWVLQHEHWSVYTTLRFTKGEWLVPMINRASDVMKYVPLWSFEESELRLLNNPAISEQIPSVQKTLVEGLYKADHTSYCLEQSTQFVKETAGVVPVVMNGRIGRIYMPGYLV
jgi:hypothetical protein